MSITTHTCHACRHGEFAGRKDPAHVRNAAVTVASRAVERNTHHAATRTGHFRGFRTGNRRPRYAPIPVGFSAKPRRLLVHRRPPFRPVCHVPKQAATGSTYLDCGVARSSGAPRDARSSGEVDERDAKETNLRSKSTVNSRHGLASGCEPGDHVRKMACEPGRRNGDVQCTRPQHETWRASATFLCPALHAVSSELLR